MYVLLLFSFTKRGALSGFSFYLTLFIKKVIFISRCYFLQKAVTVSCSHALFDVVKSLGICDALFSCLGWFWLLHGSLGC